MNITIQPTPLSPGSRTTVWLLSVDRVPRIYYSTKDAAVTAARELIAEKLPQAGATIFSEMPRESAFLRWLRRRFASYIG